MERFLLGKVGAGSAVKRPAPAPSAEASTVEGCNKDGEGAVSKEVEQGEKRKKAKVECEETNGGTLTKAEAKKAYVLTDTDLKKLPSTKVGARLHYQRADLVAASHKKHGGKEGLERALSNAKLFATKVEGKTLEQHRRALGDAVQSCISVQKWCVAARTHCVVACPTAVFRGLGTFSTDLTVSCPACQWNA